VVTDIEKLKRDRSPVEIPAPPPPPPPGRDNGALTQPDLRCAPFGRLWYAGPNAVANAIGYAEHRSRSHDAVIRVYDELDNVIETHEHKGDFKEW
jgi:hypothetical protein